MERHARIKGKEKQKGNERKDRRQEEGKDREVKERGTKDMQSGV